jgi:hypothetical protein
LTGCAGAVYNACPDYPIAGEKVAAELEKVCIKRHDNGMEVTCPHTFEWLDRLARHKDKLEIE